MCGSSCTLDEVHRHPRLVDTLGGGYKVRGICSAAPRVNVAGLGNHFGAGSALGDGGHYLPPPQNGL